jgi:hypothetical protein
VLGLSPEGAHRLAVHARALVTSPADLTGVVAGEETTDDELSRLHGTDLAADFFDDADVLVAHRHWSLDGFDASVGPQVRTAHAGGRHFDDGVGRLDDLRLVAFGDADVARRVKHCAFHD